MSRPLRVLIVEDSKDDALLLLRQLRRGGYDPSFERVDTPAAMRAALDQQTWDIVIADYAMPHFSAPAALELLKAKEIDLPFIIVSGAIGEETAVAAMKTGAHDYMMKDNLARLSPAIERELYEADVRRRHKQAEEALQKSEAMLVQAQQLAHLGSWEWDIINDTRTWSDEFYRILGLEPQSVAPSFKLFMEHVHPDDREYVIKAVKKLEGRNTSYKTLEHRIVRPNGVERFIQGHIRTQCDKDAKPVKMMGTMFDITERKMMEHKLKEYSERLEKMVEERTKKLRDAQEELIYKERMALLGHFTGNISHELRNPLGVIDSSAYYLKMKLGDSDEKIGRHLKRIKSNVHRATSIIRSLLNLTRMKTPDAERYDLIVLVSDILSSDMIPDTVAVERNFPDTEFPVKVERELIRMALKNIVKNGVEAMEGAGTLSVTVRKTANGQAELFFQDTGTGIMSENVEKIFRPLFTTKSQGVGFGLSMTKMIIENHGGTIAAESEPGKGAAFSIRLPIIA